ncbi:MAG: hypothetical protein WCJ92_05315 [Alphaproteobacteria bacterium]
MQQAFDYQSCRILIQSSFLTVERLNFDLLEIALRDHQGKLGEFSDATAQVHLPRLNNWMTGFQRVDARVATSRSTINSYNAGYRELFFVKKLLGNLFDPLQSLLSTIAYLQGIEPTIKIEV